MTSGESPQNMQAAAPNERWKALAVCVLLAGLVWIVFGQTAGFKFVNYDDADNVLGDASIAAGLSWHGIVYAFTSRPVGRWAPLTTLSHMADCQFYGTRAGRHHLTNIVLHAAVAVLLFLALRRMTGALWRSAFAAAVFAVHPLRAEVVGWVSERGDLLAAVFFMLTLLAYVRHAQAAGLGVWYWSVLALFALGLLCKPTIVMLPFVLLLLDYWPLDRVAKLHGEAMWLHIPRRLILEKIPLFALAIASCAVAVWAQQDALTPIENLSFPWRIGNALVSCVIYMWQMIYPARLAVFYPHPKDNLPVWQAIAALLLLTAVSAGICAGGRRFRYLPVGWCWYLLMLLPVLGLVETGAQAHADRYTYLPQIGLYLLVAWGIANLSAKWENRNEILGVAAGVVLALLVFRAREQASTWQDSITLWSNTIENTGPNSRAQTDLGTALRHDNRTEEALLHFQKALEIEPGLPEAHLSMGNALMDSGHTGDAIDEYQKALKLRPGYAGAHANLGAALQRAGRLDDAIAEYKQALELNPGLQSARDDLSFALRLKAQAEGGVYP